MNKEVGKDSGKISDLTANLMLLGIISVSGGIGTVIGCHAKDNVLSRPEKVSIRGNTIGNESPILSKGQRKELIYAVIPNYFNFKNADANILNKLLVEPSESTVSFTHQNAYDYLTKGIWLLKAINKDEEIELKDGQLLSLYGRTFDLSSMYDFHLASAIIDTTLNIELSKETDSPTEAKEQTKDRFLWLKDQNFDIRFENDSYAIFPTDKMETLVNILYLTRDEPRIYLIDFYRPGDSRFPDPLRVAGTYSCGYSKSVLDEYKQIFHPDFYGNKSCAILISNQLDSTGIAHEIAHHFGYSSDKFNQKDFQEEIGKVVNREGRKVLLKLDYFLTEHAMYGNNEDFADSLAYYLTQGPYFRRLLSQMRWWDPASYEILSTKYKFFQEKFEGIEFSSNGETMTSQELLEEKMSKITVGQTYPIIDLRPQPLQAEGIRLLENPYEFKPITDGSNFPESRVFKNTKVKITGQPVTLKAKDENVETFTFWLVSACREDDNHRIKGCVSGWIEKSYIAP